MDCNVFRVVTETDRALPVYVTGAGGWNHQEPMEREDGFPHFQWIQTVQGAGWFEAGGRTHNVGPGQGMLLYPHEKHRYAPVKEPWTVRWVSFDGAYVKEMLGASRLDASQGLFLTNPELLLSRMHAILLLMDSKDPRAALESSALAYQFILDLYLYASPSEVRSKEQHYEQLAPVFHYIAEHYPEPVSLQDMAGQLGVTPQHTCLLFQQTLGMRPFAYLTLYRLRKAKELLLQEPSLEVRTVAARVGYEDSSYFIKLFKGQEGITPSRFRKIHSPR
ncbi:AraC family transcriptional regulator [Paenibacillus mucilaginosus]|uniref:XylS/AraC transcriptional regulator n=1 Tax=Paenibacillus mucilaginosus (strain KNP414) TaxID=1036673 RepID=F8FCQ0_PAEMK|nr:AraC family transcriptional regulator [Paenibacillus mucilaginosus]AEI46141.1 XylS/AraC transcriptional regulator [Paenibacillus mucilaginosus KNP414]MCG7213723.1 AraC family transcriptional regulator [Paenibacillus mucilaginosus]WDM27473.1 AraC family transcriptional regulator [Paenibacillus mucilaginosus]